MGSNSLWRYCLRRLLLAIPALLLLSVVSFSLLEIAPGDPAVKAAARSGGLPRAADVEHYRRVYHLNDPVYVRYAHWVLDSMRGDLGISFETREPVLTILRVTLPRTILLTGLGLLLAWSLALVFGTLAGVAPRSPFAKVLDGLIAVLIGTPTFVVALLALYFLTVHWQLFPIGGIVDPGANTSVTQLARHVALPAIVLGISYFGWYSRVVAASISETNAQMYVTVAHAKGLPESDIRRWHLLRPSLVPFVTQIGTSLGALIGGAYVVEVVFSWPGLGRTALSAVQLEDYPVVMALVLVTGIVVILGNLLADVAVALLDPRVRMDKNRGN